jgi:predicted ester cyclase
MDEATLASRYVAYIAALNERRFDDLDEFVHDRLTYNDKPITRQQYRDSSPATSPPYLT